jgi:hypothetical protein
MFHSQPLFSLSFHTAYARAYLPSQKLGNGLHTPPANRFPPPPFQAGLSLIIKPPLNRFRYWFLPVLFLLGFLGFYTILWIAYFTGLSEKFSSQVPKYWFLPKR